EGIGRHCERRARRFARNRSRRSADKSLLPYGKKPTLKNEHGTNDSKSRISDERDRVFLWRSQSLGLRALTVSSLQTCLALISRKGGRGHEAFQLLRVLRRWRHGS